MVEATLVDDLLRLLAATGLGVLIGLNRDLNGKPTGMRTMGLVALGAGLVTLATINHAGLKGQPDAVSRVLQGVIQGVLTGISFLGAGVVLRHLGKLKTYGLTTAAAVWMTAALGIACAVGPWEVIGLGAALVFILLVVLNPLDKWVKRRAARNAPPDAPEAETETVTSPGTGMPPAFRSSDRRSPP